MRTAILVAAMLTGVADAETPAAEIAATAPRATIADAAWLAGRWVGEGLGGTMEEAWASPHGGQMVGHFALLREGRPAFYEIMLIDEFEGALRLRVKHFHPDFVGWEEKDRWVAFDYVSSKPGELVFRSLTLRRVGDNEMEGVIRIRYGPDDVRDETLRYRRAPL